MTHTAKHTPGPWVVKGNTIWTLVLEEGYGLSRPEQHRIIANTSTANIDKADAANAHLIAAAPAMYDALKTTLAYFMRSNQSHAPEVRVIRAALAQAEGSTK